MVNRDDLLRVERERREITRLQSALLELGAQNAVVGEQRAFQEFSVRITESGSVYVRELNENVGVKLTPLTYTTPVRLRAVRDMLLQAIKRAKFTASILDSFHKNGQCTLTIRGKDHKPPSRRDIATFYDALERCQDLKATVDT